MKQRILSMILVFCLMLTIVPLTGIVSSAETIPLKVAGVTVTDSNKANILAGGDNDGKVSYNSETQTLTFENGTSISTDWNVISANGLNLNVVIKGNCSFETTDDSTYYTTYIQNGSLTVRGGTDNASLTINNPKSNAIYVEGDTTVVDLPTLNINAGNYGILTYYGDIEIDNIDNIKIESQSCAVCAYYNNTDEAVNYTNSVTIKNCKNADFTAKTTSVVYAGGVWEAESTNTYRFGGNIKVSNCGKIKFDSSASSNNAISAYGGVSFTKCTDIQINAGNNGIYASYGDVTFDNCDEFKAVAASSVIYQYYIYSDNEIDYTCSVILKNCGKIDLTSQKGCVIYAGAVWKNSGDYDYRFGGNIIIDNCDEFIAENSGTECNTLYAYGGVKITDCSSVDLKSGWNALYVNNGDTVIENCDNIKIDALRNGIYQEYAVSDSQDIAYENNIILKNCDKVEITAQKLTAIYNNGGIYSTSYDYRFGGHITVDNCADVNLSAPQSGIYAYENLTINQSDISAISVLPAELSPELLDYYSYGLCADVINITDSVVETSGSDIGYGNEESASYGIGAYSIVIEDSDVTAKAGKAYYSNGINCFHSSFENSLQVTGNSTLNAYGNTGVYEYYGIWVCNNIVFDGDVTANIYGGTNGYEEGNPEYNKCAFIAEYWYDEDNGNALVTPDLTVKNGATINADSVIAIQGDVTVDNSNITVNAPVVTALSVGCYEDAQDLSTYFGKINIINKSSVIATTEETSGLYAAVFAYDSINVDKSELFASAASGEAIGTYKGEIKFTPSAISGSTQAYSYEDRANAKDTATLGCDQSTNKNTAFIGASVAKTIYASYPTPTADKFVYIAPENLVYNGLAKSATVYVKPGVVGMGDFSVYYSSDGGINWSTNATEIGTYAVKVVVKAGTRFDKAEIIDDSWSFTITSGNISTATVSEIENQEYTGEEIEPEFTVKDGVTTLAEGTDYTVAYENNIELGTATVTITGIGKYTGINTVNFEIYSNVKFEDVKTDDYFYFAVDWAVKNDITYGIDGKFMPQTDMTRAEYITMLYRAAGSPEVELTDVFTDVAPEAYYAEAVAWAYENEITAGTGKATFSPDAYVTRAQAVVFLWNANGKPVAEEAADFTDVAPDAYYAQAVAWAVESGITFGTTKTAFSPDKVCTRAEGICFIYRDRKPI